MSKLRRFGPFVEIPDELVTSAGFGCRTCHKPVERFAPVIPGGVVRMIFRACGCGCVVVWEDEHQPGRNQWRGLVRLMQKSGARVLMFNGNRPLIPSFSGIN